MSTCELEVVPVFSSVEAVREAQLAKREHLPADLYPRDGNLALSELEGRIAHLMGIDRGRVLAYNTGMSAAVDAWESAHLTRETVVLCGEQSYSQSSRYLGGELVRRGTRVVRVDTGSIEAVREAIDKHQPQLIAFETVTNGPDMPVLDLEQLLSFPPLQRLKPVIVLDHTLPSSSSLSLVEIMSRSPHRIIGVESGTKFFARNREMLGMAYSFCDELMGGLRERRQMVGSLPTTGAVERLLEVIARGRDDFNRRNQTILSNTLRLALACANSPYDGELFFVSYPNLPTHPNYNYASSHYPEGAAPVLFLQSANPARLDQYELTRRLWDHSLIRRLCRLGQSFACDQTRIWPDDKYPAVRIGGGIEAEAAIEELAASFTQALTT